MRNDNDLLRAAKDADTGLLRDPWTLATLIALGVLIGLSAFGNPF